MWKSGRVANPLFVGSNPTSAFCSSTPANTGALSLSPGTRSESTEISLPPGLPPNLQNDPDSLALIGLLPKLSAKQRRQLRSMED
jgi:hypothetical protein